MEPRNTEPGPTQSFPSYDKNGSSCGQPSEPKIERDAETAEVSLDDRLEETGKLAAIARGEPLSKPVTSLDEIKKAIVARPCTIPQVILDLASITDEDTVRWADLEEIIQRDTAVARLVLTVVNSPHISLSIQAKSIGHAASLLRTPHLIDLTLLVAIHQMYDRAPFNQADRLDALSLVRHSGLTSAVARILAAEIKPPGIRPFPAALACMLHDIGVYVLARLIPGTYRAVLERRAARNASLDSVEREVLGCDHGEVGGSFLGMLGVSPMVVESIVQHHHPRRDRSATVLAGVVALADQLSTQCGVSVLPGLPLTSSHPSLQETLRSVLPEWARADPIQALSARHGESINDRLTEINHVIEVLSDRSDFVMEAPKKTAEETEEPETPEPSAQEIDEQLVVLPEIASGPLYEEKSSPEIDFVCYLLPGLYSMQSGDRVEGSLIMAIFICCVAGLLLYGSDYWGTTVLLVLGMLGSAIWNIVTMMRRS